MKYFVSFTQTVIAFGYPYQFYLRIVEVIQKLRIGEATEFPLTQINFVARLSDFEYFACMHTSSVTVHTLPTPRDSCAYSSFCALTKAIDPRFLKHSQDKLHSLFVTVNYLYCVYIFTVFETFLCVCVCTS